MKRQSKTINVPRGKNIGKAIINSFIDYKSINVHSIDVSRQPQNRTNVAIVTFS